MRASPMSDNDGISSKVWRILPDSFFELVLCSSSGIELSNVPTILLERESLCLHVYPAEHVLVLA